MLTPEMMAATGSKIAPFFAKISATNRKTDYNGVRDAFVSGNGDIISRLEGTPELKRGDRKQPSVIKYPNDIGTAQVPHVMQFKIFWRWERSDLKNVANNMKAESAKNVEYMNKLSSYGVDQNGNFSVEELLKSPFTSDEHKYMDQILRDKRLGTIIDSSGNSDLLGLIKSNPAMARSMIEQVIKSEQTRVENIESSSADLSGKIGLDESERLAQRSGLNEEIANLSTIGTGVRVGTAVAATTFLSTAVEIVIPLAFSSGVLSI